MKMDHFPQSKKDRDGADDKADRSNEEKQRGPSREDACILPGEDPTPDWDEPAHRDDKHEKGSQW